MPLSGADYASAQKTVPFFACPPYVTPMAKLILLLVLGFFLWYGWRRLLELKKLPAAQRKSALLRGGFIALFVVTVGLVVTGRAHWITAAVAGLLPLTQKLVHVAIRAFPLLQFWQRATGASLAPKIKTAALEISISLANGNIDGKILQGEHAGQPLSALNRVQLEQVLATWRGADRESTLLLNAYMARRFAGTQSNGERQPPPPASHLNIDEARQILGVQDTATREEIIKAHKRLIQKLHPDRGGNDYLAAKVNAAKDLLTG